ncbi:uncharacterized protein DFL_005350 [Arthrobotrys flagrans]|uniref:C2H2 type master regulator of conidiophore development brlA n=1 Tax=Arthrobotrys flagrans TaxID=97331 RepID=A0A437A7V2_ARTFL|nr:hypothetical protein DFL_005350 [Arthrobotrys flagrans]
MNTGRSSSCLSSSVPVNCQIDSQSRISIMPRNLTVGKMRRLPPVYAVLNRLKVAPIDKVQELVRSADILKYTYKQQSQIHAAVAERLGVEAEKEDQGPPSFNCHICDKVVDDVGRLKRHLLTHGPRNYRCNFPGCTWTFTFAKDLERHRKTHGIAIQFFKCGFQGCGRLMNRRDNVRYHIRTVHGVQYGEANALVEVIPIDINTPDQQLEAAESNRSTRASEVHRELVTELEPNTTTKPLDLAFIQTEDEEQKLKDMFARFTTLDESKEPDNEECDSDGFSTEKDAPEPLQPQPGVQRSQPRKLKNRVKRVFYTTTRPRPPRFNRKPAQGQQENEAKVEAREESFVDVNSTTTQASGSNLEGKSLFKGLLSLGTSQQGVDGATIAIEAPTPSRSPKPLTRTPPPPPDLETSVRARPPISAMVPPQTENEVALPPPPRKPVADVGPEQSLEARPLPNPLQISPEFADQTT